MIEHNIIRIMYASTHMFVHKTQTQTPLYHIHICIYIGRRTNRQTDRQTDRHIDRHTDRQTDRQTHAER